VLRELDELRERGEAVRPGSPAPDMAGDGSAQGSVGQLGGGDAVGAQVEGPVERGDRAAT